MEVRYARFADIEAPDAAMLLEAIAAYEHAYGCCRNTPPEAYPGWVRRRVAEANPHVVLHGRGADASAAIYRYLQFDSEVFGLGMGELMYWVGPRPDPLMAAMGRCPAEGIRHLHFRVPAADHRRLQAAEALGFRTMTAFVGLLCDLTARPARTHPPGGRHAIGEASGEDLAALQRLADEAFAAGTRFHADPQLSPEGTRELHRRWVANCLAGTLADAVLVARADGELIGFITCRVGRPAAEGFVQSIGSIGLFAVTERWRGKGVGAGLLNAAKEWFQERDVDLVDVGTEATNYSALATYTSNGFRICRVAASLHHVVST